MARSERPILFALLAMPLFMACIVLIPSTPMATITPSSEVTASSTFTPTAASTPKSPLSPTVSIPTFDSFQPVTRVSLAASEHVLNLVAESDDTIWLLTNYRVMQYSQGIWTDYLPQFSGMIIGMDSQHQVWVISDDRVQVSAWNGSAWANFGAEAGWKPLMPDNGMELDWSLATDRRGQVWLATGHDIRMFDGTKWEIFDLSDLGMFPLEEEDAISETTMVFLNANGYLWALNCQWIGPGPIGGGGVRWYDGHVWQGSDSPVAHGCATVIDEDGRGNIWLGLDNDLWRLDTLSGNWERFLSPEPPEGERFGLFSDLTLDAVGNPWPELVICGGASCYTGNIRYHFTDTEWLQIGDIGIDNSSLYFDATGQGWVFASYGVFRIAGNQLEPVTNLLILKVAVSPSAKLWFIGVYESETWLWAQS